MRGEPSIGEGINDRNGEGALCALPILRYQPL